LELALTAWTARIDSGPDLFAHFWVVPAQAAALRAGVRALAMPSFERIEFDDHDEYIDASNAEEYRRNMAPEGGAKNIWLYDMIEVRGHCVRIERGYGGRSDPAILASQMRLIEWLLTSPEVTLEEWQLASGGQGYELQVARRASGAAALKEYLTAEA